MAPPVRACINSMCPQHGLALGGNRKEFPGVVFTHDRSALPCQIMMLYCCGRVVDSYNGIYEC